MKRRDFLHTLGIAPLMFSGMGAVAVRADEEADTEGEVKDLLHRSRDPDRHYVNDVVISGAQKPILLQLHQRLGRLQKTVGHGNFALIGVDEMRAYARNYSFVGAFTAAEMQLLEQVFHADARSYGFLGSKPLSRLTANIERRDLRRQRGSSQYLFKGEAEALYSEIQQVLGDKLVLTSGVRGMVKQIHLFLTKAVAFDGNLSLASRSLAPPGYSFHGIGDFDVGKRGWGERNFSAEFAMTDEFQRLQELGFIDMRYPQDNSVGVRFEPWHIKVKRA